MALSIVELAIRSLSTTNALSSLATRWLWAEGAPRFKWDHPMTLRERLMQTGPTTVIGLLMGTGLTLILWRWTRRSEGDDVRGDRLRLATLATCMLLPFYAAPALIRSVWWHEPFIGAAFDRPYSGSGFFCFSCRYGEYHARPLEFASAIFVIAGPLLMAHVGLVRGILRRPPTLFEYAAGFLTLLLGAPAFVNLVLMFGKVPEPVPLGILITGLVFTMLALGRGLFRKGWSRWMHLVVGVWMFHATVAVVLALVDPRVYEWYPDEGLWCVLFALSASFPGMVAVHLLPTARPTGRARARFWRR